jgi:hypothetical protein
MPGKFEVQTPAIVGSLIAKLGPSKASEIIGLSGRQFAPRFLRALIQNNQRIAKRTGGMAGAWRFVASGAGFVYFNLKKYARPVELGAKPHIILPKIKTTLRWRSGGRGPISSFVAKKAAASKNFIFAGRVKHPGNKARLIFPKTARAQSGAYFKLLIDNLKAALR